jgi:hypothetical protein
MAPKREEIKAYVTKVSSSGRCTKDEPEVVEDTYDDT